MNTLLSNYTPSRMKCTQCPSSIESVLSRYGVTTDALCQILEQGIECERLRLQFMQSAKSDTMELNIAILQAERFVDVIRVRRALDL